MDQFSLIYINLLYLCKLLAKSPERILPSTYVPKCTKWVKLYFTPPPGSDWSAHSFVMVVYENIFFIQSERTNERLKFFPIDNHYYLRIGQKGMLFLQVVTTVFSSADDY